MGGPNSPLHVVWAADKASRAGGRMSFTGPAVRRNCDFDYAGSMMKQMLLGLAAHRAGKLEYDGSTGRVAEANDWMKAHLPREFEAGRVRPVNSTMSAPWRVASGLRLKVRHGVLRLIHRQLADIGAAAIAIPPAKHENGRWRRHQRHQSTRARARDCRNVAAANLLYESGDCPRKEKSQRNARPSEP